ncbi:MAG: kelch repeat-containing protein [Fimbriimonadaceae bacterium]
MSKSSSVTRRTVLGGMAAAAAAPLIGANAIAAPLQRPRRVSSVGTGGLHPGKVRFHPAITALADGRLLITGGYHQLESVGLAPPSSNVQIFDPGTGQWTDAAPLKTARAQHASVRMADGRVVVLGGFSHIALSSVEIYDPSVNAWTYGAPLRQPIYGHSAAVTGNLIAISGGQDGIAIQFYDPKLALGAGY